MSPINSDRSKVFVGRGQEINELTAILANIIQDDIPRVVFVKGDYGAGKTALIEQFLQRALIKPGNIIIGRGRYTPEKNSGGYGAFAEALVEILDKAKLSSLHGENIGKFLLKIAPAWVNLIPVAGGVISAAVSTLEALQSLPKPQDTFKQQGIENQYIDFIEQVADKQPIILFVDDFQWADTGSIDLLFRLGTRLSGKEILIIVAHRPFETLESSINANKFRDARANLREKYGAYEFSLETGLDNHGIAVQDYIKARYPLNVFPNEFAEKLQKHTRGHALFVDQLFSWWEDQGLISGETTQDQTWWRLSDKFDLMVPPPQHVGEIIDARIQGLSEELQNILKWAAVEGEIFTVQIISYVQKMEELRLSNEIGTLEQNYNLIEYKEMRRVGMKVLDLYQFLHRFIRERIYPNQFSSYERRLRHKYIGDCLEIIYEGELGPVAAELSRHYSEGGYPDKAAKYALLAAQYEMTRSSWAEVRRWANEGLALLGKSDIQVDDDTIRVELMDCLAGAFYWSGMYREAQQNYDQALQFALQTNTPPERVVHFYSRSAWCNKDFQQGLITAREGLRYIADRNFPKNEAYLDFMSNLGNLLWANDDLQEAIHTLKEVIAVTESVVQTPDHKKILADTYRRLGDIYSFQDEYILSFEHFQKSMDSSIEINYLWNLGQCQINQSENYKLMHRFEDAEKMITRGLEVAKQVGDQGMEVDAIASLASLLTFQGKFDIALEYCQRGIKLAQEIGYLDYITLQYSDLALIYLKLKNSDKANSTIEMCLDEAQSNIHRAWGSIILGQIKAEDKKWEDAVAAFQRAEDYYVENYSPWTIAYINLQRGKMYAAKGEIQCAMENFNTARDLFERLKLDGWLVEVNEKINEIHIP